MRQRARIEHADERYRTSPLRSEWIENLHPALHRQAGALVASGALPLHGSARALNSSQAFAMNLALPLRLGDPTPLGTFLSSRLGREVSPTAVDLEYFGSGDLLGETRGALPLPDEKFTAADIAIHLVDPHGRIGLLLIEVKLSEGGFTPCGGAKSAANSDLGPCRSAATLFQDPGRCYLRRPKRALRDRRYWSLFTEAHGDLQSAFPGVDPNGSCPFLGDGQQPMRNHALALAAVQGGLADFWALALVHHDHNPDVPPPWDAYAAATSDREQIHRWPASSLLEVIEASLPGADPPIGPWLRERYLLP